jgi:hypothetical protein
MATNTENLTTQESLLIITSMINEAKGHLQKNSFYFLFWGWIILVANLAVFILLKLDYEQPYLAWAITIPAWIITMARIVIKGKQRIAKTHFDSINAWLWISFGITIFCLVFFGGKINYQLNPLIMLVTAIPTVVSGAILKFRPLIAGGIIFWISGITSFLLPIPIQPIVGAFAIAGGYLIPGYLLKSQK